MDRDALVALCEKRFRDTANTIVGESIAAGLISWVDYLEGALSQVNSASPWWPWLENSSTTLTATAGVRNVALPADCTFVNSVYNGTDDYPLQPFDARSGQFSDMTDAERGQPSFYRLTGSNIQLYPLPDTDKSIKVEYTSWPGALTNGATEPPFPETFHRFLVDGALAQAYLDDGNHEWHQMHQARFQEAIENMKRALLSVRTESYPIVRDTWWDSL